MRHDAVIRRVALAAALLALAPRSATAQSLAWPDASPRYDWPEAVATGAAAALGITMYLVGAPEEPRWRARNDFDLAGQELFALRERGARDAISTLSDVLFFSMLGVPIVVDSLLVAGLVRGSSDVALQTALIDLEALAIGLALSMTTSRGVGRERPFAHRCRSDPGYAAACADDGNARNTGFLSGHALMTFVSAGLVCAHHLELELFGARWADAGICGAAIVVASATSVMRLGADRHYVSDVVLGAGVGLLVGWLMPALIHHPPWRARVVASAPGAEAGLSVHVTLD